MKIKIIFAGLCLLCAVLSCSTANDDRVLNEQAVAPVTVSVNNFSMTQEDFSGTRSTPVANYEKVKAVTLAFYRDAIEVYKATQSKDDASTYTTFGSFSLALPMGSYTMVVLAYGLYDDDEVTLTSATQAAYTVGNPRDTFVASQEVNITGTSAVDISATLDRIVSQLNLTSSDLRTFDVDKVRVTFSAGGKAFNPTTGLATVNTGFSNTVSISAEVGYKSASLSYLFLGEDEQTMNVTIETLGVSGNTIYSTTVNNVPFKRNRVTKLKGSIYPTTGAAGSFVVETDWLTQEDVNF